jgi:glucose-6-phosphate 1-dehydrogenase
MPRIAGPCGVVIFGVTGDLSRNRRVGLLLAQEQ